MLLLGSKFVGEALVSLIFCATVYHIFLMQTGNYGNKRNASNGDDIMIIVRVIMM